MTLQSTEPSTHASSISEEHESPSSTASDNRKVDVDVENQPPKDAPIDPYMLRLAVKSTVQLKELKKTGRNGKRIGEYHEKQNMVC